MAKTLNFGLEKFGSEGRISDSGYKFSLRDREIMDRLIYQLFLHDHRAVRLNVIPGPGNALPALTLEVQGGAIPSAADLYYRFSFVDAVGNETEATREAPLVTPEPVDPPDGPIPEVLTTGGNLTPGLYKYAYSYYQSNGGETTAFEEGVADIPVGVSTNSVVIPLEELPPDCAGWRLYRQAPDEEEFYFLVQLTGLMTTFTDNGAIPVDRTHLRPGRNSTNDSNRVVVALPVEVLPLDPRVVAWRLYRTATSGTWEENSLVAEVRDTTTEFGSELVTTYTDIGSTLVPGTPLDQSVIPPIIPMLDPSEVFITDTGPLPRNVLPYGSNSFNLFLPANVTARIYHLVTAPRDLYYAGATAYWLTPAGDAANHWRIVARPTVARLETWSLQVEATPIPSTQTLSHNGTTGGYTLTFNGQTTTTIPWDASNLDVEQALLNLTVVGDVDVVGTGSAADPYYITFIDPGGAVPAITSTLVGLNGTVTLTVITLGSWGGTYKLGYGTQWTADLPHDAVMEEIKAALEATATLVTVTVTGAGSEEDPFLITYNNPSNVIHPDLMVDDRLLSGYAIATQVQEGYGITPSTRVLGLSYQQTSGSFVDYEGLNRIVQGEDVAGAGQEVITDIGATNDVAVQLEGTNEELIFPSSGFPVTTGIQHRASFYVRDPTATSEYELQVWVGGVMVNSMVVGTHRETYEPPYRLSYVPTTTSAEFRVKKTTGGGPVYVDRVENEVIPTRLGGFSDVVEIAVEAVGSPPATAGNVNVAVWM